MKRTVKLILSVIVAAIMIAAPMTVFAFAPVGDINVLYGTPTIDGTLAQGEWSENNKIVVDANTATATGWLGEVPASFKIDFYYTWDDTNLYFAAAITDPDVMESASGDNYNGDAFQISLNVGQVFKTAEYERAIFYSWGLLADGTVDIFRQESANNAVIENVGLSSKTATGWQFELAMPWSTLVADVSEKAGVDVTVASGLKIGALICYLDHDAAGTLVNAFGTSLTDTLGWDPDAFGINLILVKQEETAAPEVTEAPADTAATSAPATTTTAAQTSDAIVISALIAVAAAGAAIIYINKKK